MKVRVKLFGLLPSRFPSYDSSVGMEVEIPDGTNVSEFLAHLEISRTDADIIMADGLVLKCDSQLQEGMCLHIFTLISGG